MTYHVGTKGQVVKVKEIRERLGVKPGWVALQRLIDDRVEIFYLPPEHDKSLRGSLASYLKARVSEEEAWQQACETAWERVIRERYSEPEA